uniref:HSF-type DNA-binding domain-containing protein n=1 Tax=Tetraodon nigroviridis TaxID=99883 RepID=H3C8U8_TETNG
MESQVLTPTTEILKKLSQFKGIKFLSFVRQLHHYGFRESVCTALTPGFHHSYHPRFKKNHPELLRGVRRQVREHKRARAHPYKQTPAHRNAQDLHRGNLHQWPKQPFPVAPKHFPIPAQPLYMPGMPPGLAYNTGDHLGFMHHPYMNGIPNVLQFGVPVANHFSPGCYMPAVWWNQQMPVNPFPYDPINFYQPTNLGFQPTGFPAGGP